MGALAVFHKRAIQQFDDVQDFLPGGMNFRPRAHLQQAARICRDDDGSAGRARVLHLFRQYFERSLRLGDIVGACGAATIIGHGHFDQFHAGDRAHQLARGFADFLAVQEMAGILIRHAERQAGERRAQSQVGEKLGDVPHLSPECVCLRVLAGAGFEKLLVLLERRAAPGGVGDDGVEIIAQEDVEICAREGPGGIAHARMRRKRAAAGLSRGNDDFAAVRREHSNRRVMQRGKADLCDAAGEQRHARAARTHGRIRVAELREEEFAIDWRQQPLAVR